MSAAVTLPAGGNTNSLLMNCGQQIVLIIVNSRLPVPAATIQIFCGSVAVNSYIVEKQ